MKALTVTELREWCKAKKIPLDERGIPALGDNLLRFEVPKSVERLTWFCNFLEAILRPRDHCVMWVTEWGVWESSENWHLYYRLRESYGDRNLLEEAPGHVFLSYEGVDLVTFVEVALISGWDVHLLPAAGLARAFASHDGWVAVELADDVERTRLRKDVIDAGLRLLP